MASEAQIKLAGKEWGRCCAANRWRMARGRLDPQADLSSTDLHKQIAGIAEQHALQNHRAITVEDLRRACVAVAANPHSALRTPHFCSTHDLNNKQMDALLTNYSHLRGIIDIRERERERYLQSIRESGRACCGASGVPLAYLEKVSLNRFGTREWTALPIEQLRQMAMSLRTTAERKLKMQNAKCKTDDNEPF